MDQTFDDLPLELLRRSSTEDVMSEPSTVRKRKSRSTGQRVRTGCLTCKARRVKCDEKRPTCQRCRDSRRKCGGYDDRGDTPEQSGTERQLSTGTGSAAGRSRSRYRGQRATEAFEFFQKDTVFALDCYFPSDFWAQTVLPMSQTEASIHYAVIAVGAAHAAQRLSAGIGGAGAAFGPEDVETNAVEAASVERFTLESYNRAIQALNTKLTSDGPQAVRVVLVSCILFVCLEALNNQPERAIRHVESGRRILNDWSRRARATEGDAPAALVRDEVWKNLWRLYSRLLHQVLMITGSGTEDADDVLGFGAGPDSGAHDPGMFDNMTEAQDALDNLSKLVFRFLKVCEGLRVVPIEQAPAEIVTQRQHLANCVRSYEGRFAAFLATSAPTAPEPRFIRTSAMVRVHGRILKIMLGEALDATAATTAGHEVDFDAIVDECEQVVQSHPLLDPASQSPFIFRRETDAGMPEYTPRAPSFTLACGLPSALYFASQSSRSMPTRLRAVALLKAANANDGIWSSSAVAKIAEKAIEAEAAGAVVAPNVGLGLLEMGKRLRVLDDERRENDEGGDVAVS